MTSRERFKRLMRGQEVDRAPFWFGGPRASTFEAWMKQGLSQWQRDNWKEFVGEERGVRIGEVDALPVPRFEERVIEEHGNKKVWIDEMGATRIDHRDPATPGFVTRSYLEFPVKNRDDFLEMKKRYNPRDARRYLPGATGDEPEDPSAWEYDRSDMSICFNRGELCRDTEEVVNFTAKGLFWTLRDWCGFEGLCMMFYDQPDLVHEMMDFWTDFLIELYDPVLSVCKADYVITNEDMAYKHQAMISVPMMRAFIVPRYKRLIEFFKGHGIEFVVMDSDGHCSQVCEAFIPEGLDGVQPMEIAANNDPADYLEKYPRMVTWGGIDKRELRFTRERVRAEVRKRFEAQRKYGRYIPTNDHGVPPDIPLRNFLYMIELCKGFASGEDLDTYEPPCVLEKELGPITEMFDPLKVVPRPDEEYES